MNNSIIHRERQADPFILHLINYPFLPTSGQSEQHCLLIFQVFSQRAFEDTSPTKIVMNLASPCGPPIKTNCDFFLGAESISQR